MARSGIISYYRVDNELNLLNVELAHGKWFSAYVIVHSSAWGDSDANQFDGGSGTSVKKTTDPTKLGTTREYFTEAMAAGNTDVSNAVSEG